MDEVIEAIEKYQGLVPLVYDIETMVLDEARPQDMPYAVYLKREADKVIAHQKYKRCLAMAAYCHTNVHCIMGHRLCALADWKKEWFERWHRRWLELAEKFKDKEA